MKKVLILMGPNLNLIGEREKNIYGEEYAEDINKFIKLKANSCGLLCDIFQSNWEGAIIDKIHQAQQQHFDGIILNAGALSHYSIALRDAIASINIPCIEVHMSNIYAREDFRRKSIISEVCIGQITGFGKKVYTLAIDAFTGVLYE